MQIGGLCHAMTIKDVSRHMRLDWHTVKDLEKIFMREQLRLAGPPRPEVIGVDERYPSARATPTGSLSATWRKGGPSGSAAKAGRKRT